ncbi:unnamed protein product, partial [Meganyctiphanes norvegica]
CCLSIGKKEYCAALGLHGFFSCLKRPPMHLWRRSGRPFSINLPLKMERRETLTAGIESNQWNSDYPFIRKLIFCSEDMTDDFTIQELQNIHVAPTIKNVTNHITAATTIGNATSTNTIVHILLGIIVEILVLLLLIVIYIVWYLRRRWRTSRPEEITLQLPVIRPNEPVPVVKNRISHNN